MVAMQSGAFHKTVYILDSDQSKRALNPWLAQMCVFVASISEMDASYRRHANELLGECPTLKCTMHGMAFDIRHEAPALDTTAKKDVIEETNYICAQIHPHNKALFIHVS